MFDNPYVYFALMALIMVAGYFLPRLSWFGGSIVLAFALIAGISFVTLLGNNLSQEFAEPMASKGRGPASVDSAKTSEPPELMLQNLPNTLADFSGANPRASVAYRAPKSMQKGEDANVKAVLSLQDTFEALKEKLKQETVAEVQVHGEKIDVASRMIATLSGYGFSVDPAGPQEQPVLADRPTTWNWQIKADREGLRTLVLKIDAVIGVDGESLRREIDVKQWEITVAVGWWEQSRKTVSEIGKFLADLKELWLGLAFFITLVTGWFKRPKKVA
jgi:hypothetical protein